MDTISLILFVFILGLRHGLDADHLACIDGLVRYNWRLKSKITPWVGTLFSFGHGMVVAGVAIILSYVSRSFKFPDYFDTVVTWVSIVSLLLIGTLNLVNLVTKKESSTEFKLTGLKGKWIPKIAQETTNPFHIILIGSIFAFAAETVSQTSVWALAASNSAKWMPIILGLVFMIGMMITDTIDSYVTYRMLDRSGHLGAMISRIMGWIIVALAYGVALYQMYTYFVPSFELDFEIIGVIIFSFFLGSYLLVRLGTRSKAPLETEDLKG